MSGIIDNRTRIIDTIMTQEGRRQLSNGDMKIKYFSFNDATTYYKADIISGSSDASDRIYFECSHLPQDQIVFESDDSGLLKPFQGDQSITIKEGYIVTYAYQASTSSLFSGSSQEITLLSGSEFASTSQSLLKQSLTNFQKLRIISSKDKLFEDDGFGVGSKDVEFIIHDNRPLNDPATYVADIDNLESLFNDPRLSNLDNFSYLPPVNKIDDNNIDKTDYKQTSKYHLGQYKPLGRSHLFNLDYDQIMDELQVYGDLGYSKTIRFDPTSKNNRLLIQVFEQGFSQLKKLDVIDYGILKTGNPDFPLAHIFFIGKLLIDSNNTHTFIHLFTMVFE